MNIRKRVKNFLNIFWLRPENAMYTSLRSKSLDGYKFKKKSLDISCGDGIFTFTHLGGEFDTNFDIFLPSSVDKLNRVRLNNYDIFNTYSPKYSPKVIKRPEYRIDYGIDWKNNLLKKAKKIDLYKNLNYQNNEKPIKIFPNNYFDSVYSNSIYWIKNLELHTKEIIRITKKGGHILLHIKNLQILKYRAQNYVNFFDNKLAKIIDRGRESNKKGLRTHQWWINFFKRNNLKIVDIKPVTAKEHAVIWDIGLRPFAPMLIEMANSTKSNVRKKIKKQWIEHVYDLLYPLINNIKTNNKEAAEHLLVLEKK